MVPSIAQLPDESVEALVGSLRKSVNTKQHLETVIREKQLVPLWNTGGPPSAPKPHTKHIPSVWHYEDTKSLLLRAGELVDAKEAERRAVLMINPGPKQPPFTLDALLAAHQLILPGEQALCHRHTPFAVRFLIEGEKGYTAISGKKMYMVPGDLIITPSWNWHDHGNESNTNVIWLDGLNIPLFKYLPVDFTEVYEEEFGALTHESKPVPDEECTEMKFPWKIMQARLDGLEGDHVVQEYTLPDGKSVSTTIGAYAHRISAGKASKFSQDTAGYVFQVHGGSGWAEVHSLNGDTTYKLTWSRGDAFVIPSWHCLRIFADESETVYLFSFSDRPMLENLGFWRAKGVAE